LDGQITDVQKGDVMLSVEMTKDVEREDLWRFVMSNDLISLSIDNRLY
jgi:hypothetical protein